MRYRILGPLRVRTGTGWTTVAAEKQRTVLAVLLADAGRPVRVDRLVDAVWGDQPPRKAVNTVQAYVMRLRRLLPAGRLVTRAGGYELMVDADDVDAMVFERLAADARRELDEGRLELGADRLKKALALWRGPVFADVPATASLVACAAALDQARLAAEEDWAGALLDLDRHEHALGELPRMVEEYPLREVRWVLLMRALHGQGRRAEALDAYRRARRVLREELGLEPGGDLRALQQAVLTDADRVTPPPSTATARPAQLPAQVSAFTGRVRALERLDALTPGVGAPAVGEPTATAVVIFAIAGTAGVGKTALAVHWAHRVTGHFPDGQLYLNLHGHAAGPPVAPIEALGRFLRALDVPPEAVPSDMDEASALFRSRLAGRRMLVLLDNARDPDQVRPLLPGTGGCLALVTSRQRLDGLIARDGAIPLPIDVLSADESHELLTRLLGDKRVRAEPAGATGELARLCDHLPLALRLAAADLVTRPHTTVAEYVQRLGRDRLNGLDFGNDGIRAAFDLSYHALPDDTRRVFRLLGLAPGPDIAPMAAAALTGTAPGTAAAQLDQLAAAHLVDEQASGRFTMHDLIHAYAAELATTTDPDDLALHRLYDHYLRHADAAASMMFPNILRLPDVAPDPGRFSDLAEASAWLDGERANLVAAVVHAAEHGPRSAAWRLADALRGYFNARMSTVDWQLVAETGLAAAVADGDRHAIAAGYISLGMLDFVCGRFQDAIDHDERAAAQAREAGWPLAEATALGNLAGTYATMGDLDAATERYLSSLVLRRQVGWLIGEASVLGNLGQIDLERGRLTLAAEHLADAGATFGRLGATIPEARADLARGDVYHALGRLDDAASMLAKALEVFRAAGARLSEGNTLTSLADVHRELGDRTRARPFAETALLIAYEIEDRGLESTAVAALASLDLDGGAVQTAIDGHDRALHLAREAGASYYVNDALIRLAGAHARADRLDRAAEVASEALDLARHSGYRMHEGRALTVLAEIRLDRGELDLACDLAEQAADIHLETGHRPGHDRATAITGRARHAVRR